jgi:hypothetical protein
MMMMMAAMSKVIMMTMMMAMSMVIMMAKQIMT